LNAPRDFCRLACSLALGSGASVGPVGHH
jgi:hypothetical protein